MATSLTEHHSEDHSSFVEEPVQIETCDKFTLSGTLFMPAGERRNTVVVFNSGAGIAARHYREFARFLAESGVATLTYDYRGIGRSRPTSLRHFSASVEDWAEYDCGAAIEWMATRFRGVPVFGVGHSIGCLLFGGAPNANMMAGLVMVGPHTAYVGDYRPIYRVPMALLWHGIMPMLTTMYGYFPGRKLGLGDDIPRGIAMEWARRRSPDLAKWRARSASPRADQLLERFSKIDIRTAMFTIADDGFATPAGAARVKAYLPKLPVRRETISARQAGVRKLGHFGFFRRSAKALWPRVLAQLRTEPKS